MKECFTRSRSILSHFNEMKEICVSRMKYLDANGYLNYKYIYLYIASIIQIIESFQLYCFIYHSEQFYKIYRMTILAFIGKEKAWRAYSCIVSLLWLLGLVFFCSCAAYTSFLWQYYLSNNPTFSQSQFMYFW